MTRSRARKPRRQVVLLRPVPGQSVIHDLWAGSKLLIVAGIGVLLTFYPGWVPIGAVALLVVAAAVLAHIPAGYCRTCRGGSGSCSRSGGSPRRSRAAAR